MASPQTIVRDGSGTQSVSYVLPPGLFQYIESVLVQVNNGSASDVKPELAVATVNGEVMATKRQGRAIPAGDTGSATWALRLDDEQEEAASFLGAWEQCGILGLTVTAAAGGSNLAKWGHDAGATLLSYTDNQRPTVLESGIYACSSSLRIRAAAISAIMFTGTLTLEDVAATPNNAIGSLPARPTATDTAVRLNLSVVSSLNAGDMLRLAVANPTATVLTIDHTSVLQRLD